MILFSRGHPRQNFRNQGPQSAYNTQKNDSRKLLNRNTDEANRQNEQTHFVLSIFAKNSPFQQ